jgi:hypothetical protein
MAFPWYAHTSIYIIYVTVISIFMYLGNKYICVDIYGSVSILTAAW